MVPTLTSRHPKMNLNLAIVGGGRACRFFLELLQKKPFSFLDVHIAGVCDLDCDAEGFQLARTMGIYTTCNYKDLFTIDNLDSILELTNSQEVLHDLIDQRPKDIGIIEHNIGRLLRAFFLTDQRMKSLEHQLFMEKMASDILIQHSDAAIMVLNSDFTVVEANEVFLKKVQKTKEEAVGGFCYQVLFGLTAPCPNARPARQCPMIETLRTGRSAHVIQEMVGSGIETFYENVDTYPLIDSHGKIIRIIEIRRDISDEIKSRWDQRYQKIKREMKNLIQEERMVCMGKLAASCVHEINNPIQGLLTFTDLMQSMLTKDKLNPGDLSDFKNYLALMSTELERCGRIVSGLLSFSREKSIQHTDINLNDVIQSVVDLTRHKMEMQGIDVQIHLSGSPLMVSGDTNCLQQCMLNLVFNAMEAMPDGGKLTIVSGPDKTLGSIIEIKDTGQGIAERHLSQLFEPFFTTKSEGQGTGLGLSIVYNVVKSHRGDIKVDSREGQGSRFVITFPHCSAVGDRKA